MNAHLYLRASTKDQDANRARESLEAFAAEKGLTIAGIYSENISGTKLNRPALMKLLESAQSGDVLLCESVDRLSRLTQAEWGTLKAAIEAKGLRLVVMTLPTTHALIQVGGVEGAVMTVINNMLVDLMAAMARIDQDARVARIRQGLHIKRVREPDWKPAGKGKNAELWKSIKTTLAKHPTMNADEVAKLVGCGVATIYRVKREMKA